jgi:adenylylsulfate kinase-like enzyme
MAENCYFEAETSIMKERSWAVILAGASSSGKTAIAEAVTSRYTD